MGSIFLIRHGQASAFTDDYDRLSALGYQQSRDLAARWIRSGIEFSSVFSGPLQRQKETASTVAGLFRDKGLAFPDVTVLEGLKEIDADLFMGHIMKVRNKYPDLDRFISSFDREEASEVKGAIFQEFFESVMLLWMSGQLVVPEGESLAELKSRVTSALESILERREGTGNIAVFTSATPVAIMTGHLMGLDDRRTLEIAFGMNNGSITEFALESRGPVLRKFNCTGHLHPDEVTLR